MLQGQLFSYCTFMIISDSKYVLVFYIALFLSIRSSKKKKNNKR